MGFRDYLGNHRIVAALRSMLREERVPGALLFTGARGTGKFTLARMIAQAANCERLRDDFCGECETCRQIAALENPQQMIERGLAERGESADAAAVERTPLILEAHPDVWAIVPDPVRLKTPVARPLIRASQLRAVQRAASYMPQARRRVFIVDDADTIRWNEADLLLKTLEEAAPTVTFILVAMRPDSMQATIRSRCISFQFAPVPETDIEHLLKTRTDSKAAERQTIAQLSGGSPGAALSMNLSESLRIRREALNLLERSIEARNFAAIFSSTAQIVRSEQGNFEKSLEVVYSLLADLLALGLARKSHLLRNPDLRPDLQRLSARVDLAWVSLATFQLDRFLGRLRRNIGRQLGLDAVAVTLARTDNQPAKRRNEIIS